MTEITEHLKTLIEVKDRLKKDVRSMGSTVAKVEQDYRHDYTTLIGDIDSIKGPLIDYISDNQHESGALGEEILRQNEYIRSLAAPGENSELVSDSLRVY